MISVSSLHDARAKFWKWKKNGEIYEEFGAESDATLHWSMICMPDSRYILASLANTTTLRFKID